MLILIGETHNISGISNLFLDLKFSDLGKAYLHRYLIGIFSVAFSILKN